jgi:hypothetical protein
VIGVVAPAKRGIQLSGVRAGQTVLSVTAL